MARISDRLATAFVQAAEALGDQFDLIERLQMATAQTSDPSPRAVFSQTPKGELQFLAASDAR